MKKVRKTRKNKRIIAKNRLVYPVAFALILASVIVTAYTITQNPLASHTQTNKTQAVYHNATDATKTLSGNAINQAILYAQVTPQTGYTLPFKWGNSIKKLVGAGALNVSNLTIILNNYHQPLTFSEKEILNGTYTGYIQFNSTNTEFVQLVLWGLGINDNNTIITKGAIINASVPYANSINNNATLRQRLNQNVTPYWVASRYFASTGGYGPIGKLQLGMLNIISLSPSEQIIADYTAENSYRPCCDNPTAFPDCNHGAAALGLTELLASQGANKGQIFNAIRYFYQYQFPQQYTEIAAYFDSQGQNYSQVNSSKVMSYSFSSLSGYYAVHQYLLKNGVLAQSGAGSAACGA